jgi:hypothetical protein
MQYGTQDETNQEGRKGAGDFIACVSDFFWARDGDFSATGGESGYAGRHK